MTKTKIEKIADIKEQIRQLENQRKQLLQQHKEQERKDRTRRLIERGAIVESLIPGADALTNEQIKSFLEKTIKTEFARKILSSMKPQDGEAVVPTPALTAQNGGTGTQQNTNIGAGQAV